jgi:hypothetical protein
MPPDFPPAGCWTPRFRRSPPSHGSATPVTAQASTVRRTRTQQELHLGALFSPQEAGSAQVVPPRLASAPRQFLRGVQTPSMVNTFEISERRRPVAALHQWRDGLQSWALGDQPRHVTPGAYGGPKRTANCRFEGSDSSFPDRVPAHGEDRRSQGRPPCAFK